MKKKIKIFLSFLLVLILSSCTNTKPEELNDLILTPESNNPVLEGTWEVTKIEDIIEGNNQSIKVGDKLYISKNLVAINDEYAYPPTFTSKYVNLEDYLINRGYENFENINKEESVVVVNASQGQYFSRDFIQRSEDDIFFISDDKIVYLSRFSNKVDSKIIDKYSKIAQNERTKASKEKDSTEDTTIILGIRERIDLSNNQQDYNYYTYLLRIKDDDKLSYKKAPDIFLRNQDEYWKVRSLKNNLSGLYDNIEAFPVRVENNMDEQANAERYGFLAFDMNIKLNYVDSNYISFSYLSNLSDNIVSKYGVLSTNELKENNLITIDEFTGENDAYDQLKNMVINEATSKDQDIDPKSLVIDRDNFGIVRDNGSWVIQTSIYTKESQQKSSSQIPIRNYIEDDTSNNSSITKDQVKNINLEAKDYFILGNGKYILIQTADEILIYKIKHNEIEKRPIYSIITSNPSAIISFDQQTGSNAQLIENAFINSNTIIDEK
ncbi:hypothetical protein [uncultured Anaerococcus sp.]|uniref:hypothetical protein n=1 Tax=uncultured Anaerococcus sp. TaxID=293428 RepID=UPI002610E49B|nr:hypothetical protein [uncultured Anaerococcus sp.]